MKGRVLGLDHVGIAVRDPRQRLPLWAEALGLPLDRAEVVPTEGVRTWLLDFGGGHIELLEPLSGDSPIARAIEKRGEGIHHLCLAVDDIEAALARLAARGIEAIGGGARPGAGGCRVAFLHPKDTGGVLLELSERPPGAKGNAVETADAHPFATGTLAVLYVKEPRARMIGAVRSLDGCNRDDHGLPDPVNPHRKRRNRKVEPEPPHLREWHFACEQPEGPDCDRSLDRHCRGSQQQRGHVTAHCRCPGPRIETRLGGLTCRQKIRNVGDRLVD